MEDKPPEFTITERMLALSLEKKQRLKDAVHDFKTSNTRGVSMFVLPQDPHPGQYPFDEGKWRANDKSTELTDGLQYKASRCSQLNSYFGMEFNQNFCPSVPRLLSLITCTRPQHRLLDRNNISSGLGEYRYPLRYVMIGDDDDIVSKAKPLLKGICCVFCLGHEWSDSCPKYSTPSQRHVRFRNINLTLRRVGVLQICPGCVCREIHHPFYEECVARHTCVNCTQPGHHSSLCTTATNVVSRALIKREATDTDGETSKSSIDYTLVNKLILADRNQKTKEAALIKKLDDDAIRWKTLQLIGELEDEGELKDDGSSDTDSDQDTVIEVPIESRNRLPEAEARVATENNEPGNATTTRSLNPQLPVSSPLYNQAKTLPGGIGPSKILSEAAYKQMEEMQAKPVDLSKIRRPVAVGQPEPIIDINLAVPGLKRHGVHVHKDSCIDAPFYDLHVDHIVREEAALMDPVLNVAIDENVDKTAYADEAIRLLDHFTKMMNCSEPNCTTGRKAAHFCKCGRYGLCTAHVMNSYSLTPRKKTPAIKCTECSCKLRVPTVGGFQSSRTYYEMCEVIGNLVNNLIDGLNIWKNDSTPAPSLDSYKENVTDVVYLQSLQFTCPKCQCFMGSEYGLIMKSACNCGFILCRRCLIEDSQRGEIGKYSRNTVPGCSDILDGRNMVCKNCDMPTKMFGCAAGMTLIAWLCRLLADEKPFEANYSTIRQLYVSVMNDKGYLVTPIGEAIFDPEEEPDYIMMDYLKRARVPTQKDYSGPNGEIFWWTPPKGWKPTQPQDRSNWVSDNPAQRKLEWMVTPREGNDQPQEGGAQSNEHGDLQNADDLDDPNALRTAAEIDEDVADDFENQSYDGMKLKPKEGSNISEKCNQDREKLLEWCSGNYPVPANRVRQWAEDQPFEVGDGGIEPEKKKSDDSLPSFGSSIPIGMEVGYHDYDAEWHLFRVQDAARQKRLNEDRAAKAAEAAEAEHDKRILRNFQYQQDGRTVLDENELNRLPDVDPRTLPEIRNRYTYDRTARFHKPPRRAAQNAAEHEKPKEPVEDHLKDQEMSTTQSHGSEVKRQKSLPDARQIIAETWVTLSEDQKMLGLIRQILIQYEESKDGVFTLSAMPDRMKWKDAALIDDTAPMLLEFLDGQNLDLQKIISQSTPAAVVEGIATEPSTVPTVEPAEPPAVVAIERRGSESDSLWERMLTSSLPDSSSLGRSSLPALSVPSLGSFLASSTAEGGAPESIGNDKDKNVVEDQNAEGSQKDTETAVASGQGREPSEDGETADVASTPGPLEKDKWLTTQSAEYQRSPVANTASEPAKADSPLTDYNALHQRILEQPNPMEDMWKKFKKDAEKKCEANRNRAPAASPASGRQAKKTQPLDEKAKNTQSSADKSDKEKKSDRKD